MLSKHPDLLIDEDIRTWIQNLISNRTPESVFLDYKETQGFSSTKQKLEVVKDITSFANEEGGVVLYGICEERNTENLPVPKPPVGIDPIPNFAATLEDIYVESISPRLPEYRIRHIQWSKSPDKVIYLGWVPKSWDAPHMIYAHGENRYYRRGNFRAVPMQEYEIERLYRQRQSLRTAVGEFLRTGDFGEANFLHRQTLRVVLCPNMMIPKRIDVLSAGFYESILHLPGPEHRSGQWEPILDGFRFLSYSKDDQSGVHEFELRIFSNGSISLCVDLQKLLVLNHSRFDIRWALQLIENYVLKYGLNFLSKTKIEGPMSIDVLIRPASGIQGIYKIPHADSEKIGIIWRREELQLREETTVREIDGNLENLVGRLKIRLASAFGLWLGYAVD